MLPLQAQYDFKQGYIVTPSSDTIRGLIENWGGTKNAHLVQFKKSASAEAIKYEPKDILAYGFTEGKMFESKNYQPDSVTTSLTFMELLQSGKLNFYFCRNDGRFYVEKNGGQLYPLFQTEKIIKNNGTSYLQVRKDYVGILNLVMDDCAEIKKKIEQVKLEYNHLQQLIARYNACGNNVPVVQTKGKQIILRWGFLTGIQSAGINFDTESTAYVVLTKTEFGHNILTYGGAFLQTTIPWTNQRVSLVTEAHYRRSQHYADQERSLGMLGKSRDEVYITASYVRVPIMLRYTFSKGSLRPYVQAGIMIDRVLSQTGRYIYEYDYGQVVNTYEDKQKYIRPTILYNTLGIGVDNKLSSKLWWFVELRGGVSNNLFGYVGRPDYIVNTKMIALQTGIGF
jgi:hypothetical protein